jgi:CheY-like chemotaxis protein
MGRGGYYSVDSLGGIYTLVVDNEPTTRAMLTGVLQYCGALVAARESIEAALDAMKHVKPDVVVVTVAASTDDAYELCRCVRALKPEAGGTVPLVAVGDGPRQESGRGFDAYLPKPFDPWELCRVIANLVLAHGC